MNNYKTTIAGALAATAAAILIVVQQGHDIADWKTWVLPAALALFGFLAKDGSPPDAVKALALVGACLSLNACNIAIAPDGTPTIGLDPVAALNAYNAYTAKKGLPPVMDTTPVILPIIVPTK